MLREEPRGRFREYSYPARDRSLRFLTGQFFAFLVAGGMWLLVMDANSVFRITMLSSLNAALAPLAWLTLRGAIERRRSLVLDHVGVSIVVAGKMIRSIAWSDVTILHHVGLTLDPHCVLQAGVSGKPIRIYYQIEHVEAILEKCVGKAPSAVDAYSIPFTARRPALPKRMRLQFLLASSVLGIGTMGLVNGVPDVFVVLALIGGAIVAGPLLAQAKQPSLICVSETGIAVETRAEGGGKYARWDDISDLRLGFSQKAHFRPVLSFEWKGGTPLVLDLNWIDPIRLLGLMKRTKCAFDENLHSVELE